MANTSTAEPDVIYNVMTTQWFGKLGRLTGIDVFDKHYKPTAYTYALISVLVALLLSCLHTIIFFDFDSKVICASVLGFCLQGLVKYHQCLQSTTQIRELMFYSSKHYQSNTKSSPNKACLQKSVNLSVFVFKYGLMLLVVTAVFTALVPFVVYLFIGQLEPILPTYIPGINEKESIGYAILAVFHCAVLFIFVTGTAGVDLSFMIFVFHSYVMSQLFQNAVNDLNSKLKTKSLSELDVKAQLNNFILMHQDTLKFTNAIRNIYSKICLIQISMANSIMCLLVYVILMINWFPAYFCLATAFFQVFEYSFLGTIVTVANEKVYDSICKISVPDLPIREQKKVILMLLIAQHPPYLKIGGIQELNVTVFVSSLKTTYTVGMLLVSSGA